MPYRDEVSDITAYAFDSRAHHEHTDSLGSLLGRLEQQPTRWPVHNREERWPIDSQKRAIIHERDGGICRLCGTGGHVLTVDHIIPRSTYQPDKLHIADRSDNLISACWECNMSKSNYEAPQSKRIGVTACCWECLAGVSIDNDPGWEIERPEMNVIAFCGRCGITRVPSLAWIL